MSEKTLINKLGSIAGNAHDHIQRIENYFYPEEEEKPKKAVVYFRWKDRDTGEERSYQSTFFSSSEQLKEFIYRLAELLGYFMQKKGKIGANYKYQAGNIAKEVKEHFIKGLRKADNN